VGLSKGDCGVSSCVDIGASLPAGEAGPSPSASLWVGEATPLALPAGEPGPLPLGDLAMSLPAGDPGALLPAGEAGALLPAGEAGPSTEFALPAGDADLLRDCSASMSSS